MSPLDWLLPVILLAVIIFLGRAIIPRSASFFFPRSRRLYFEDNPVAISSTRRELIQPVIEKMEALGFSQLGFMVDKPPLWSKASRELALGSPAHQAFASIGFRGGRPSYFFYTAFSGGQAVITAYNAFRHFRSEDLVTEVVSSGDPQEMLESHKKAVEAFTRKGLAPYNEYTRESFVAGTAAYYNSPYPRRQLQVAGATNLAFLLLCIAVFALAVWALVR